MASALCLDRVSSLPSKLRPTPFVTRKVSATSSRTHSFSKSSRILKSVIRAASAEPQEVQVVSLGSPAAEDAWIPVCQPEDLPKGVRKEVEVDGKSVLLFWYRNEIYAIESRSPAEGAYSEGFIQAKFTQDFCIECPTTGTLFSLKDGSIVDWYPRNAVLRALTPKDTVRNLQVYPVKLTQEAIYVDVTRAGNVDRARGGADTSLEGNNVFAVQPTVYFEGMDPRTESASVYADMPAQKMNPAVALTGTLAFGALGVAGSALAIYNENLVALAVVWITLGGTVAYIAYNYVMRQMK